MDRIKIGFDIDGVALRYTDEFAKIFKLFGGKGDVSNNDCFNYFDCVDKSDYTALYLSFGYIMQSTLKIHTDFLSIMNYMIRERKQPMQFITARQDNLSKKAAEKSLSIAFYEKFGAFGSSSGKVLDHWINVKCVKNRGDSKLPFINYYGMKYFVDDRRKTCLELSQNGIICFMPRRTWNTLPEDTKNIIQYDDSSEIVKYLKRLSI